ncbi:hypothetical protein AAFF_G00336780, partial [Aldrovandia affinis]
LLKDFPDELRCDITMHLNKEVLQLHVFSVASRVPRSLSLHIRPRSAASGSTSSRQRRALQAIFFVCFRDPWSTSVLPLDGRGTGLCVCSPGKGDLIGANMAQDERVVTKADVKALTYCDLQCIALHGLQEVLQLYPEYALRFARDIQRDLTYNLREGQESQVTLFHYSQSVNNQRSHWRVPSAPSLCFEFETRVFPAPRVRVVDGTEDSADTESSSAFKFSLNHLPPPSSLDNHAGAPPISTAELAAKAEETRGHLKHLNHKVSALGQEVSELGRAMRTMVALMEGLRLAPPPAPPFCPAHPADPVHGPARTCHQHLRPLGVACPARPDSTPAAGRLRPLAVSQLAWGLQGRRTSETPLPLTLPPNPPLPPL